MKPGRPRRVSREGVAAVTLAVRLTPKERAALDDLVARKQVLAAPFGAVTAGSVVRWLIAKAAAE